MASTAVVISCVNQKGGTAKSVTTENLGIGLAMEGKKVLLVDTDPQESVFFEPNRRPAAIACHNSRLYGRLPLAKVVFFVYSHFASDNKNPHR